jgi:hypothetical protein
LPEQNNPTHLLLSEQAYQEYQSPNIHLD